MDSLEIRVFPDPGNSQPLSEAFPGYEFLPEDEGHPSIPYRSYGTGCVQVVSLFPFSARIAKRKAREHLAQELGAPRAGFACRITAECVDKYRGSFGIPIYVCRLDAETRHIEF